MHRIVNEVFTAMHRDGLIYRGYRVVNWDPKLETTVSDDEVERREEKTTFYTFQYGPFSIGTARPETKFGDKYVVMHPDDLRYSQYRHGQTFEADWINGKVKATVIKDKAIDQNFGTGVMTITPWHDLTDFEIAERHKLDKQQIIGLDGRLLDTAGEFKGMTIEEARPKVAAKLKAKGLLVKEDKNYEHAIALNSRGGGVIEPQIMLQWFIDVNNKAVKWKGKKRSLKEVMRDVVESKDTVIVPARFSKTYFHWIDNLRDWCISRQIWWGHRIPAYYRKQERPDVKDQMSNETELYVGVQPPEGEGWQQDPDTLDTWFSSAMWTWSTLIDRDLAEHSDQDLAHLLKRSPDFQRFHPTNVLETGYDILFFWVARMILMTTYATGQIPFKTVYLHGLVRTREGKKMSKSDPGTTIDPLEMIPKYGADALRLSMLVGQTPGNDTRLYEEKIAGQRNFCNKLWNVARYVIAKLPEGYRRGETKPASTADFWILDRLSTVTATVSASIDKYRFSDGAQTVYHFLWDDFADWYIEATKSAPNYDLLVHGLEMTCKLAHPFAPFVTEAIWQIMYGGKTLLMGEEWPEAGASYKREAGEFEVLRRLIGEIRFLRSELQLSKNWLYHKGNEILRDNSDLITRLSGVQGVREVSDGHGLHLTTVDIDCWIDVEEQITRDYLFKLIRRRDKRQKEIAAFKARLASSSYLKRAPKEIVEDTRARLAEASSYAEKLNQQIETLERELQLHG